MIEMSVQQGVVLDTTDPEVRNPELWWCFRHEGEDCPRCDGSCYRPRKRCAGCGEPSGKPSEGGQALQPSRIAKSWEEARSLPLYCRECNPRFSSLTALAVLGRMAADMPAADHLCCECYGTGWILYRSETVDDQLEEAYCLCPNCCAPRYCMARSNERSCPRPGTVRYGLRYFCKEHVEVICCDDGRRNPRPHEAP